MTEGLWIRLRRWLPLLAIVALMSIGFALGWHRHLTLSTLIKERARLVGYVEANLLIAALTYIAIYIVSVALSFPGASILTIVGGFLFGWFLGGTLTAVGATIGACCIFLAARSSLGAALKAKAGPFVNRLAKGFRDDAFNYLLFLRLTPIFPFWLVNIAPALFDVRLRVYAWATFIGILPGTYAYSFVGTGLDSIIEAQEAANPGCAAAGSCRVDIAALVTPEIIIAFAALGIVSLLPVVIRKLRGGRRGGE
ncbi:TVP38/TMEM64 family protein [Stappia albiluteola]|nr:TVP38/TMEM64 family protein [Stappia albiluteola]